MKHILSLSKSDIYIKQKWNSWTEKPGKDLFRLPAFRKQSRCDKCLDEALSKQTFNAFVYPSSRHQTEALLEIPQFGRCENYCTSNATASSQPPKDLRIEISKSRRHRADLYKHFLKVNKTTSALTD